MKELESSFKTSKLKVYLNNPINLTHGKILDKRDKSFIIYDNIKFAKFCINFWEGQIMII